MRISSFIASTCAGATELQPRWKRCVQYTDGNLGEALGQVYVRKTFGPELKASTVRDDAADRRCDGGAHSAAGLDESDNQAAGAGEAQGHSEQSGLSGQVA